ncbi:MAG TPA: hypothetical protein VIY53_04705 [Acidobacteriaceae bacterium]
MTTFPATAALFLFPAMLVLLEAGRRMRRRHGTADSSSAIGGAIFGLFGLQPELRQLFRDYTTSRLHLFDAVGPEISPTSAAAARDMAAVAGGSYRAGANPDAVKLLVPALNDMIDITSTRQNVFNMHPPGWCTGCCSPSVAGAGAR